MGSSDTKARPAYVHDADENEEPISGTRRTARQKQPVLHRRTGDKVKSKSDTGTKTYEHVMSGARQGDITEKNVKLERRKSSASSTKSPKKESRPPSAHTNKAFPKLSMPSDHPSHFGISSTPTPTSRAPPVVSQYPKVAQPIPLRPRPISMQTYPTRPVSYHAAYGYNTGPPIANSAFYQPLMAPSYPPPSPSSSYMRYASTPQPSYFPPQPMPGGRPLSQRFDPITRSSSAFGMREAPAVQQYQLEDAYDAGYNSASEGLIPRRRASIRTPSVRPSMRSKAERDFEAMPPPATTAIRPGILRNKTTEYHPEIPDQPRERSRTIYRQDPPSRRPSTNRNSVSYDLGHETNPVRVETANTSHRRQSYYGQSASVNSGSGHGSPWEDQAKAAQDYQADVGATAPLTAEMLKRQQRRQAGSSRSTKSSGSHDESDYRRSATTRTTRSGSGQGDDGFTIKVKGGQARVMVDGAQIDCTEGGEIQINRQKSIRNGSERSGSEYGSSRIDDRDRRSRGDRPSGRSRKSSVGGNSYTRTSHERHLPVDYTTTNFF